MADSPKKAGAATIRGPAIGSVAGPDHPPIRHRYRRWSPKPLIAALIRCGENSLAMYCFGVLPDFMGFMIFTQFFGGFATQAAISFAGIALMIAAADRLTWEAKLDRHGPKLF
jgi:hypothetical protein